MAKNLSLNVHSNAMNVERDSTISKAWKFIWSRLIDTGRLTSIFGVNCAVESFQLCEVSKLTLKTLTINDVTTAAKLFPKCIN